MICICFELFDCYVKLYAGTSDNFLGSSRIDTSSDTPYEEGQDGVENLKRLTNTVPRLCDTEETNGTQVTQVYSDIIPIYERDRIRFKNVFGEAKRIGTGENRRGRGNGKQRPMHFA